MALKKMSEQKDPGSEEKKRRRNEHRSIPTEWKKSQKQNKNLAAL